MEPLNQMDIILAPPCLFIFTRTSVHTRGCLPFLNMNLFSDASWWRYIFLPNFRYIISDNNICHHAFFLLEAWSYRVLLAFCVMAMLLCQVLGLARFLPDRWWAEQYEGKYTTCLSSYEVDASCDIDKLGVNDDLLKIGRGYPHCWLSGRNQTRNRFPEILIGWARMIKYLHIHTDLVD